MQTVVISTHDKAHEEIFHFVEAANEAQKDINFRRVLLKEEDRRLISRSPLDAIEACRMVFAFKGARRLDRQDVVIGVIDGNLRDEEDDEYFSVSGLDYPQLDGDCPGAGVVSLYHLNSDSTFMNYGRKWWRALSDSERKRITSDSVLLLLLGAVSTATLGLEFHPATRGCIMDYCNTPTDIVAALKGGFHFCKEECLPALRTRPVGHAMVHIANWLSNHPLRSYRLPDGGFDVFLCHNSADKPEIKRIAEQLKERGIVPWLDEWECRPGLPFKKYLESQIKRIRSAAVFVGTSGIGPWQDREQDAFVDQFVRRKCSVIPVILESCAKRPRLPVLLESMTWVDFRQRQPDPLERLIWGITGNRPGEA